MNSITRGSHFAKGSSDQSESTSAPRTIDRRALVTAAGAGLLLPGGAAMAQQSPPIEPRNGATETTDEWSVIEPEPTVELSPDDDAGTIIRATGMDVRYFAETGHNLEQPFLGSWSLAGAEAGPGVPLSEARIVDGSGVVRQDFEAMALLFDQSREGAESLRAAPLPESAIQSLVPAAARATVASCEAGNSACQHFPESGHTISGTFLAYWQEHGNRQLIGLPRSEPFRDRGVLTQVFDGAVLQAETDGTVSMRKVNIDLAARQFADDAAFVPVPPTRGTTTLVTARGGLRLRSGPDTDAEVIAVLPNNAEFIAAPGEHSTWVPGYVDGYSGWVAADFLAAPDALPAVADPRWRLDVWQGIMLAETNVRAEPTTTSRTLGSVAWGEPIVVVDWVRGEPVSDNQITWAQLESGGFVYARNIARAAPIEPPPLPADALSEGRWIDVHLTQQLMVAYEGRTAVRTVVTTTGMPGWRTPPGFFRINHRVANETMESGSIGAEFFYVLKDVLFTQYFTDRGHALHYAWWKSEETIGRPGSHGCLNLLLDDAQFFWDWATIGTPVVCRTV